MYWHIPYNSYSSQPLPISLTVCRDYPVGWKRQRHGCWETYSELHCSVRRDKNSSCIVIQSLFFLCVVHHRDCNNNHKHHEQRGNSFDDNRTMFITAIARQGSVQSHCIDTDDAVSQSIRRESLTWETGWERLQRRHDSPAWIVTAAGLGAMFATSTPLGCESRSLSLVAPPGD